MKDDGFEAIKK